MNIEQQEAHDVQGDNRKYIDFDNILEEKIKLGRQQGMIFICGALLWLSDGAELLVVGFTVPIIQKEWNLTDFQLNWLGSGVFTFWALGAMMVGKIADKIGRKRPIIWGATGQFIFAVASAFAPNYWVLVAIRSCFGFCLGLTAPVISTLFSETFPKKNRGRYFVIMNSAFVVGELLTVGVAYYCLDSLTSGNWRLLLVWSSFPGLVCLFFLLTTLTESPRYLLICTTKYEKAFKVIDKMIKRNHKKIYEAVKMKEDEKEKVLNWINKVKEVEIKRPGYKQLFNEHYQWITIKTMLMWFSLSFVYYGIMYILPTALFKLHGADMVNEKVREDDNVEKDNEDFAGIALTALVEIPSCVAAAILIEIKKVGRKNSLAIAYLICSICCFIIFFLHHADTVFFVFVSGAKVMINFCFQIIYPFTAEIYDTNIRSTGCGFNNSICRIGGILMPWLSFVFFYISNTGPFLVFGAVTIISFIAAASIKQDTTGQSLDQFIVNDSNDKKQQENQQVKGVQQDKQNNNDYDIQSIAPSENQYQNNDNDHSQQMEKNLIKEGDIDVQIELQKLQ